MPTVFRDGPYRFYFYAEDCREPIHVHVEREGIRAKFWVDPVGMAPEGRFQPHELRQIKKIVEKRQSEIVRKWNDFCP